MGFDDIRFARHIDPPLTTIAQPMRQIGEGTVRLLLGILAGGGDAETPEFGDASAQSWSCRESYTKAAVLPENGVIKHASSRRTKDTEAHEGSLKIREL